MANRYWVGGGSSTNWSATGNTNWASTSGGANNASVPTSTDDVFFDANSGSGTTVITSTSVCRDITCIGFTGTLSHPGFVVWTIYGSITLASTMIYSITTNNWINLQASSGTYTITTAGKSIYSLDIGNTGTSTATWTLQDNYTGTGYWNLRSGTINTNGKIVNLPLLNASFAGTKTITLGATVFNLTGTSGNVWNMANPLTLNANTSTIAITNTGSSSKTFTGGGKTYNDLSITVGGTGVIIIQGNNTFTRMLKSGTGTKTIQFTAGSTQTFTGGTNCFFSGTSGNLITCQSTSNGSAWTITKSSNYVSSDYLSLKDSNATGGAIWYAGNNSTNVSGNSGWIFTAPIFTETLSMTIVSDTLLTDLQTYKESLNFTIVSNITLTDLQTYIDNLNLTISSIVNLTDLQNYVDNLNLVIISDTSLTDLQLYNEVLNLIITSQTSINDLQNYKDDLNFTIVAVVDLEDDQVFPKDTFKPIFLKRQRLIAIDLNRKLIIPIECPVNKIIDLNLDRKRIIDLRIKKSEPIKISLRRKIR